MIQDKLESFANSTRGETTMNKVISMAIAVFVISAIIPVAITQLVDVDTTGWPTAVEGLWELVPIFVILAVVLFVYSYVQARRSR